MATVGSALGDIAYCRAEPSSKIRFGECRDSVTGTDVAEEVRQYFIPDFTHWKHHDAFEAAFARLLRDLKAAT
jgi:hypothetical protein